MYSTGSSLGAMASIMLWIDTTDCSPVGMVETYCSAQLILTKLTARPEMTATPIMLATLEIWAIFSDRVEMTLVPSL